MGGFFFNYGSIMKHATLPALSFITEEFCREPAAASASAPFIHCNVKEA
jgi:hypothetical protein